jgi:hypothetical protein
MILPWILVLVALGAAILGLSITLKRKAESHRQHHPVPERDITPHDRGEVHGRMREQTGTYVGPS